MTLPTAVPPFRLRTFGSVMLLSADGTTVFGEHGQQRRRLALLAVLAAAGDRGRTRDQLMLLFWPDVSQRRARHSLDQLVYAVRNALSESVFVGTNPLRLNTSVVTSDVELFDESLTSGDLAAAVEQYTGPFLDGFYLSDAPEFEQWAATERAQLAREYAQALERLAEAADAEGDHKAAAAWWRRLSDADPISSKAATGLVRALMKQGDNVAALRHAEEYQRLIAQELGTSGGPTIAALITELRAHPSRAPVVRDIRADAPATTSAAPLSSSGQDEGRQQTATLDLRSADTAPPQDEIALPADAKPRMASAVRTRRGFVLGGLGAAMLLALAIAWSGRDEIGSTALSAAATADTRPSVAVLPLANLSGAAEDAAIVDGLTEELIGMLARLERLRVVGPTSAFALRNSELRVGQLADSLGVTSVLEGGVQKAGQRLRVRVRLVDARTGSTRWAETYDRELQDIFAVQTDIATAVARELDVRLAARDTSALRRFPTKSIAAYELYLRGRDPTLFRLDDGPQRGLAYLQQATALDSNFAGAYANMAYMYMVLGGRGDARQTRELHRQAEAAARKAVTLDPFLPEAHAAVGVTKLARTTDLTGAEASFRRALALPGYSRAREHLAKTLGYLGRPEEALSEAARAVQEDPLSATAAADLGLALCLNRRYQDGLTQLSRLATLRPPLRRIPVFVAICRTMKGEWQAVADTLRDTRPELGDPEGANALFGYALARSGQQEAARQRRSELVPLWERGHKTAFRIALIHAGLREYDEAIAWLHRAIDDSSIYGSIMYPYFAELHTHPGFESVRRRLGIQNR